MHGVIDRKQLDITLVRNIEFAIAKASFRGLSGEPSFKNIKRPYDIRPLPWLDEKPQQMTPEQAGAFIRSNFDKKK